MPNNLDHQLPATVLCEACGLHQRPRHHRRCSACNDRLGNCLEQIEAAVADLRATSHRLAAIIYDIKRQP